MSVDNTSPEVSQKKRKRVKPERPTVEPIPEVTGDGNSKFARALGSSDWQTREKGLQALTRWLSLRQEFDENDMKKIWKGLFYAFWHSDKGPVQVKNPSPPPPSLSTYGLIPIEFHLSWCEAD